MDYGLWRRVMECVRVCLCKYFFLLFQTRFAASPQGSLRVISHQRIPDPIALAIEKHKVAVMDQTVNHSSGHLLIMEDLHPFAELEVCGHDQTHLFISV